MHQIKTLILFCAVASTTLAAQTADQARNLQTAQALEQAGQWKDAVELYERLWKSDTTNFVYFDALRRGYTQLKEYDKAIAIISARLRFRPMEVYLNVYLGGLLFDAGKRASADSVWEAVLRTYPKNRQITVLIAQSMQERRLYDRAMRVYEESRTASGNPVDFVEELALLHSATQQYGAAVAEYLRLVRVAPHQLPYIESRIASFTMRDEGLQQAWTVVDSVVKLIPNEIPIRSLLVWIAMERGDYGSALEQSRTIDDLSGGTGKELCSFADRAVREGHPVEAEKAYRDVINSRPPSPLRAVALLGLARTLEGTGAVIRSKTVAGTGSDARVSESPQAPDSAVTLYEQIIREYPGTPQAIQARFQTAMLQFERFFDLDAALLSFQKVIDDPRSGTLAWEALLRSADVLLAKGDLPGAAARLNTAPPQAATYLQDRLTLIKARVAYLSGQYANALRLLSSVTASLDKDVANDGLELSYRLLDGAADSVSLTAYAKGELLIRERKFGDAAEQFRSVSMSARTASLASSARLQLADLLVSLQRPREAIALLDSVVETMQTDILRDRAAFRMGDIYDSVLHDQSAALSTYEKFLTLFPTSLYAQEARKRIRILRGDAS